MMKLRNKKGTSRRNNGASRTMMKRSNDGTSRIVMKMRRDGASRTLPKACNKNSMGWNET